MPTLVLFLLAAPVVFVVALAALTGAGSRRRGAGWPVAVLSGLGFPVTWVAWYVKDEYPAARYRRGR